MIAGDPSADLNVRVLFCRAPGCDAFEDTTAPALWYTLEHPFYLARRTAWAACIDAVASGRPTEATEIPRCAIHGCADGMVGTGYCEAGSSDLHFCETGGAEVPPDDLE